MVVVGLLIGLVGTDVNSGMARYAFDIPELVDGIGFTVIAVGLFAVAEIVTNLSGASRARSSPARSSVSCRRARDLARSFLPALRGTGVGAFFGLLPGHRPGALVVRRLHAGEEARARARALRQGRDRGCRGAGSGEQCRGAGFLHPHAHARHPGHRGHGADAWRDGHAGRDARAAGDDRESRALLGNRRQHVDRQPHAARAEPAARRRLGAAAARALPLALSLHRHVLRPRQLLGEQQPGRRLLCAAVGVLGYVFAKLECEPAPLLLGYVLGPLMEEHLRRAMLLSRGDPSVFFTRPISLAFMLATLLVLVVVMRGFMPRRTMPEKIEA